MTPRQLGRIHAVLRVRLHLRQQDVAEAAGIKRRRVVDLEAGRADSLRLRDVRASFEVLGASITIFAEYRGAELARVVDELHARLLARALKLLGALGWESRVEVSFSVGRERGSIDILAWNAEEKALLVVEIKSELPGIDPMLRPLDVKVRLAPGIARRQFGWQAQSVSRVVVLPEERTARRHVVRHGEVLRQALPLRAREIRRWLRSPRGAIAGLWFLSLGRLADTPRNPSAIRRVQRPQRRVTYASEATHEADARLIDPHNVRGEDN